MRPSNDEPARGRIDAVVVVVPARDEQALLERCLVSVHRSLTHPSVAGIGSCVVTVLDDCSDGTPAIAHALRRPPDHVLPVAARNVGRARHAGSALGIDVVGVDPARIWLAHTDADTVVPRTWIARQLALARRSDAVAGVVRVDDWSDLHRITRWAWSRRYHRAPLNAHEHIHGANLGVRASAYLAVGGFPGLPCSEDRALWDALQRSGARMARSRRVRVTTSARTRGRAPGGFADALASLESEVRARRLPTRPQASLD